jgi:predicted PurR-regulated permease PerM
MQSRSRAYSWAIAIVVALILLYLLRDVVLPFVAGFGVAYILAPLVDRLTRYRLGRGLAATIALTLFFAAGLALVLMTVPILRAQVTAFGKNLPAYIDRARKALQPKLDLVWAQIGDQDMAEVSKLVGANAGEALSWIGAVLGGLISGGAAIANILSLVFIMPIVAFYLLRDWDQIVGSIDRWLPRTEAETIRTQFRDIDRTLAGFARGQALVCLVVAAFYAIGLTLAGLDFGVLVGIFSGLATFIPFVGAFAGGVFAVSLAMIQFETWTPVVIVGAIFVAGQALEGNVLTPWLVGDRVGLHPVWVIFALLAGGALFGFLGLLLAVPVAASIGVLVRFALTRYLDSPLYRGPDQDADHGAGT